jgi:hypothetical protein
MNRENGMEPEENKSHGMVIIPVSLLEKIDLNRDKLSRADFIELCLDTLLQQGQRYSDSASARPGIAQRRKAAERGVSHADFEEFKDDIKELLRSCVDYLPERVDEQDTDERSRRLQELLKHLER